MGRHYGLDDDQLEELAATLIGTRMPLSLGLRKLDLNHGLFDAEEVIQQLMDTHDVGLCTACHTWCEDIGVEPVTGAAICGDCDDIG